MSNMRPCRSFRTMYALLSTKKIKFVMNSGMTPKVKTFTNLLATRFSTIQRPKISNEVTISQVILTCLNKLKIYHRQLERKRTNTNSLSNETIMVHPYDFSWLNICISSKLGTQRFTTIYAGTLTI